MAANNDVMIIRARQFVVLLLVFSTGCASPMLRMRGPKDLFSRNSTVVEQDSLPSQNEANSRTDDSGTERSNSDNSSTTSNGENPFGKLSDWEPATTGSLSTSGSTEKSKDEATSEPPKTYKHDVATRMMIDAELRGVTKEEREAWQAYLATVETSQVPKELQIRRGLDSKAKPPQTASTGGDSSGSHPLIHATIPSASNQQSSTIVSPSSAEVTASQQPESFLEAASFDARPSESLSAFNESEPTPESATESATESVPGPTSDAAGDNSSLSSWPRRLKSLAEPSWLRTPNVEAEPLPTSESGTHPHSEKSGEKTHGKSGEKATDRIGFNLPLIRGHQAKAEATPTHPEQLPDSNSNSQLSMLSQSNSVQPVAPKLTPGSQLWEDEIQKLISLLEAETTISGYSAGHAEGSRDALRKQIILRMLYVIENDPVRSQQTILGVSSAEQEFWTELFMGLSQHLDQTAANDPADRASQTVAHLRNATHQLQKNARLRLRNMTFCQKINGFGSYDLYPIDEFIPGQTVLLYTELKNFQSNPTDSGVYVTRVKSTIELYDNNATQKLVDRTTFEATEDHCRTLRSDYFHSYRISLPAQLQAGPHVLKLIIEDELSGKTAVESIEFEVRK